MTRCFAPHPYPHTLSLSFSPCLFASDLVLGFPIHENINNY